MTSTHFHSLTDTQQLLLGFAAYKGTAISDNLLDDFAHKNGISDCQTDLQVLKDKGLYTTNWGIGEDLLMKTIIWVIEEHPYWPSHFMRQGFSNDANMQNIWLLCIGSKQGVEEHHNINNQLRRLITPLLKEERYYHILDILTGREIGQLVLNAVRDAVNQNRLTEEGLVNCISNLNCYCQFHNDSRLANRGTIMDELEFYRYLITGNKQQFRPIKSTYNCYVAAIYALYQGDTEEAVNLFREGTDRSTLPKELPDNLIAAFFSILALLKNGNYQDRLERIARDNGTPDVLKPLACIRTAPRDEISKAIRHAKAAASPIEKQILFYISKYCNLGNLEGFNVLDAVPNLPIMHHELAPYLGENNNKETFGGESILASVPKQEDWSGTFADLERLLKLPGQAKNPRLQSRVKFVFFDNSILGLREQKLLPDGSWGEEKLLAYSQYIECGYPFMDDTDEQIALALKDFNRNQGQSSYRTEAEAVLPFLIGSDRVYGPHGPIRIDAEKPHIRFRFEVDHIVADTNIDVSEDGRVFPCKVKIDPDGNCTVICPNPQQRRILELLLKNKNLPITAAESLADLGDKMKGVIDVDTTALRGLDEAPTLQGTGKIIVRIKPDGTQSNYAIEWQALPIDAGEVRFVPGEGAPEYLEADEEGKPHRVIRDMNKEMDNLNALTDFITATPAYSNCNNKKLEIHETENLLPLLEFLYDRPDDYAMEWPEGTEIKFKGKAGASCWEIGFTTDINWFGVEGNVNVGGAQIPLKKIIKEGDFSESVSEFVRIGEKEYIRISKAIQKQLAALQGMMSGGTMQVSKYQVGKLAEVLGMGGLPQVYNTEYADQLRRMQEAYDLNPDPPAGLNATLREYQLDGYRWMCRLAHWGAGGCLADDMGLGKTIQTIAFMLSRADKGPSLVIAPTSVVPNWEAELKKFAPDIRPIVLNNVRERAMAVRHTGPGNVVISSYGILANSTEALLERDWNIICLDEAHQIKNRWTRVSHAAMELKGESRMILTGTPVQNSLNDLWNLFQFINPGMLGKFESFKEKYSSKNEDEAEKKLEELKTVTQPFILRRTKDQVLDELPKKTEIDYMVTMSPAEMLTYENMRSFLEMDIVAGPGGVGISVFEGLTKLRLACCSMEIQDNQWAGGSSKLEELKFLLQHLYNDQSHVLVFSQFTSFLTLVKKVLKEIGIPFLCLDGGTPLEQRADLVQQFQDGDIRMFLISLKAGGLGLNLTAANYVILLDPWWNPSIEEQAIDRAYRIGQTQDVTVIRMLAEHTIEQKIVKLQDKKRHISDHILQGAGSSNTLTYEEILEMVSPF